MSLGSSASTPKLPCRSMPHVAVAAPSTLAADAAADVARRGGNAIDAAVGAALVSMISEPGICALGGSGFVAIGMAGERPFVLDGNAAMPGLGLPPSEFGHRSRIVEMAYGGGVTTTIGHESVAVPGGLAALGTAIEDFGTHPWSEVVAPAVCVAESGFPLSAAAAEYLTHSHDVVFGWDPVSHKAVHRQDGSVKRQGDHVNIDGLFESLREIARDGAGTFYKGDLAGRIVEDSESNGGLITARDLREYAPVARPCVSTKIGAWTVFANPPPSVGGPVLLAMLELAASGGGISDAVVHAQSVAMRYRSERLDTAEDLTAETRRMIGALGDGTIESWIGSPSTIHVSAADSLGNTCAITMSSGYGSGVIPAGTGIWMNNSLGEEELNRRGFHAAKPGERLPSNMAPTIVRHGERSTIAIGSPGADRITTALQQTILGFAIAGLSLQDAIDAPRRHVEFVPSGMRLAHEPGAGAAGFEARPYEALDMYFGGVTSAGWDVDDGLSAAADPRRTGGIVVTTD